MGGCCRNLLSSYHVIVFLIVLTGISCPRAARPGGPGGVTIPSDPYGDEALAFIKDQVLQREVRKITERESNCVSILVLFH